jgi:peptide/nickel transport system permease protein
MFAYIVRRVAAGIVMILAMSLVTMVLFFASPADPARFTCGKNCTPELLEQNRKALGYDKPVLSYWADFTKGIFVGSEFPKDPELKKSAPETIADCPAPCLGYSPMSSRPVRDIIVEKLPVSASLAVAAFIMWMIAGVGLGIVAALRKGRLVDRAIVGSALVFYAFPTFFIGLGLYVFLALKWGIVPVPAYTSIADGGVGLWLQGLLLPALTLALVYIAGYIRLTRAFVLEAKGEDYLRTAQAKGLKSGRILFKHTLRGALTPIATVAGLDLGGLLGGTIITEQVFNYDGLGRTAVQAATTFDLPVTVGIVLVAAAIVITANIVVDVLYAVIDPRVKYS